MAKAENLSLIARPPAAIEKAGPRTKRILSDMVTGTLTLAKREHLLPAEPRFRIGEYEWCGPEYRQILTWAKALKLRPEEVIERLLKGPKGSIDAWWETRFENGMLLKVSWDFELLPLWDFQWVDGLGTTHLFLHSQPHMAILPEGWARSRLPLKLPQLTHFACRHVGLRELDLSECPRLHTLDCSWNWIAHLDLASVPGLTALECQANNIEELDVSSVAGLIKLNCERNGVLREAKGLRRLTMRRLPNLTSLSCSCNQLPSLDLSGRPNLTSLDCSENHIRELDLSTVPLLERLSCHSNPMKVVDIRPLHHLEWCYWESPLADSCETQLIQRPDQHFDQHF
jgi:hypothetical protein